MSGGRPTDIIRGGVGQELYRHRWSQPTKLVPELPDGNFRFSSIASGLGATFVLGLDLGLLDPAVVPNPPLLVLKVGQGMLPPPADGFAFMFPHAVTDSDTLLTVVWGEPDPTAAPTTLPEWFNASMTSLWTASYENLHGWSEPVRVHSGRISWGKGLVDDIVVSRGGNLHLVTPANSPTGASLLYARRTSGRWSTAALPTGGPGVNYSSITAIGDTLLVAFIASPRERGSGANVVYVIRSTDHGSTWSQPTRISRVGDVPAFDLRLRSDTSGRAHLVWIAERSGRIRSFRHTVSADVGTTWDETEELAVDGAFVDEPQLVVDEHGAVHVVFRQTRPDRTGSTLAHAVWSGHWHAVEELFPGLNANDPSLTVLPNGDLFLVFLGRRSDAGPDEPLATFYSTWELKSEPNPSASTPR